MDNITIACQLNKNEKTVINHFTKIYGKFREWQAFSDDITINCAALN